MVKRSRGAKLFMLFIKMIRRRLGDPLFFILIGLLLLLLFCGFLVATGQIRGMVTGEPLYDLMFADRFPFPENIRIFFEHRVEARLMHGVLITVLYKIFGFNPTLFYLTIQLLIIVSTTAIVFLLRDHIKQHRHILVLMFVLFLLPTLIPESTSVKKMGHSFAWASFWIACIFFQNWIRSRKILWLVACSACFLAAMLSYEVIGFLLPIAVFVSTKEMKRSGEFYKHLLTTAVITVISSILALSLALTYQGMAARVPSLTFGKLLAFPFITLFSVPYGLVLDGLGEPLAFSPPIAFLAKLIALTLLLFGLWVCIIKLYKTVIDSKSITNEPQSWLAVAGLWIIFLSYTPFLFVGQAANEDSLVGVGYGLVFLLILLHLRLSQSKFPRVGRPAFFFISVFLIIAGVLGYQTKVAYADANDHRFVNFILTLREIVPNVKENTVFVLVNTNWGRTGCIGYMNMLYSRNNLRCIHLLDGDTEESYISNEGVLTEDTGRTYEPDLIILSADSSGEAILLESIAKGQFPLIPVTWLTDDPIKTNPTRILLQDSRPSRLYEYALGYGSR